MCNSISNFANIYIGMASVMFQYAAICFLAILSIANSYNSSHIRYGVHPSYTIADPILNVTLLGGETTRFVEDETRTLCFAINGVMSSTGDIVAVVSSDTRVANVVSITVQTRKENDTLAPNAAETDNSQYTHVNVTVHALRLGVAKLLFSIGASYSSSRYDENSNNNIEVIVVRKRKAIDRIFFIVVNILLVLVNLGFGCSIDLKVVQGFIRKPVAPIIGFTCQFLLMPLIGVAISQAMRLDPTFGLGLIALACSPGGGASNAWTLLLGGDVNLSLTMTFMSMMLALGMMPLWLFILSRLYFDPSRVRVPFVTIVTTLAQFILPCLVGVVLCRFAPKVGERVARLVRPLALIFLLWIFTCGTYVNWYMWRLMGQLPKLIPSGMLLPWCGFAAGYVTATVIRLPRRQAITVAIETGIQNIGIPLVMLQGSFPQPYGDLAATMSQVVGMFTPLPLYLTLAIITIKRRCFDKRHLDVKADAEAADGLSETSAPSEEAENPFDDSKPSALQTRENNSESTTADEGRLL